MADQDKKLKEITDLLTKEYKPSRLILFGSRAKKGAAAGSDYDFVMVLPQFTGDRMKVWEQCQELILSNCGVLADVFTYSEKEFLQSSKDFSSIPETALNTGKEIKLGSP